MNWNRPNPLRGGGSSGVARVRRAAYSGPTMPEAKKKPHYHGHRLRLRERFRKAGADALADYELMEMVLFMANARGDVKPLAKTLIDRFGTFADAIAAPPERLAEVSGIYKTVRPSLARDAGRLVECHLFENRPDDAGAKSAGEAMGDGNAAPT